LGASTWVHYQQWQSGLDDIRELAAQLRGPSLETGDGPVATKPLSAQLTDVVAKQFSAAADDKEKQHFTALARIVAHDLERHGTPDNVRALARRDTLLDFLLTSGAQALFVLWIPSLLMISIARARDALATRRKEPGAQSGATCVRVSLDHRDMQIL